MEMFEAPRDSGHVPCVVDFAVKPKIKKTNFKYFTFLSTHPRLLESVQTAWSERIFTGSKMFTLKQRLKSVKEA